MKTLCVLMLLTAAVYAGSLSAGFVYEDTFDQREPWQGWKAELQAVRIFPRGLSNFAMRLQAGQSAGEYHAVNVALHLTTGIVVYALVAPVGVAAAITAATLWLLHPLGSEAVLYVSARTDLLAALFVLLMLYAVRVVPEPWTMPAAIVCALCAVWSKESAIIVVSVLPLWLWWNGQWSKRWIWPCLGGLVGVAVLTVGFTRTGEINGVSGWDAMSRYTSPATHGPFWFVATQCAAIWRMIALFFWPRGFTVDHDWDLVTQPLALLAMIVSIVLVWTAWRSRKAAPTWTFCVLFIVAALAPRFVVPLPDYVNEHQFYLPRFALCFGVGMIMQFFADLLSRDLGSISRFASEGDA